LPFSERESPLVRIKHTVERCLTILESTGQLGSYFGGQSKLDAMCDVRDGQRAIRATEDETQQVYGRLWDTLPQQDFLGGADDLLAARLRAANIVSDSLRGKNILDIGAGSGRYSFALARLGAASVCGIDRGAASISRAQQIATEQNVRNVRFQIADVLELPLRDNTIDFAWCNGVLHHSENIQRGLEEIVRVLKPGGRAFVYLYGSGGLFWTSRARMRHIMRHIPQSYSMMALELLGMPQSRFIFVDSWHVPIEEHTSRMDAERMFRDAGFANWTKVTGGRPTDLDVALSRGGSGDEFLYGDGEHRYVLAKALA